MSKSFFASNYEYFEWQERQVKQVINGQRGYDWLGIDWRLPLWSDELMDYWLNIPFEVKFNQQSYIKYLKKYNFQGIFDIELPKNYSYFPLWLQPLRVFIHIACRGENSRKQHYYRKYLKYFMSYAPFYPQQKYFDYLIDSEHHRNVVSFFVKEFIEEEL
tara:strand:- start:781 stop:1260 length:480 start_codon:yes stop_codon:yes gene_type:complete